MFENPTTESWNFYSPVPIACQEKQPCILGVDEAGRGPVMGSMVYALSYTPVSCKKKLATMKFAGIWRLTIDSKVLKEDERDDLFESLQKEKDWIGWAVHACSPQDISESSFRRNKYNLNAIAHDTTIAMIQHIYIDTVGPPDKYREKLEKFFPGIHITVAKKADSLYPIVSAASICAKVTRDRSIKEWKFIEPDLEISRDFGSGYPSGIFSLYIDPNTVKWLKENMDPVFGYPRLIRFSWSTTSDLLETYGVPFQWGLEGEADQPTVADLWDRKTSTRDDIYKRLEIKNITSF